MMQQRFENLSLKVFKNEKKELILKHNLNCFCEDIHIVFTFFNKKDSFDFLQLCHYSNDFYNYNLNYIDILNKEFERHFIIYTPDKNTLVIRKPFQQKYNEFILFNNNSNLFNNKKFNNKYYMNVLLYKLEI